MADVNKFVPFVLHWAAGVVQQPGESVEQLFERAKRTGWSDHPLDRGGATQCDVTLKTYREFCRRKGMPEPSKTALRNIPFAHWREILKTGYWDVWKADRIKNQGVAEILVDWVWGSGAKSVKAAQRVLGVTADGIVGEKTLAAVNAADASILFMRMQQARWLYVEDIVRRDPSQKMWRQGWLNRINDIKFR